MQFFEHACRDLGLLVFLKLVVRHLAEDLPVEECLQNDRDPAGPVASCHSRMDRSVDDDVDLWRGCPLAKDLLTRLIDTQLSLLNQVLPLHVGILAEPLDLLEDVVDGLEVRDAPVVNLVLESQNLVDFALAQAFQVCLALHLDASSLLELLVNVLLVFKAHRLVWHHHLDQVFHVLPVRSLLANVNEPLALKTKERLAFLLHVLGEVGRFVLEVLRVAHVVQVDFS